MKRAIICLTLLIMLFPFSCIAETIHGLDTNEGYFSLTENNSAEDIVVLNFLENGHIRYMLAYRKGGERVIGTSSGIPIFNRERTYYDYFNNKPILTVERVYDDNYIPIFNMIAESASDEFFTPNTSVADINATAITEYDWFWNFNLDLTPGKYKDMRIFYESVFQTDERFPRKQITPADHPQSRIPRYRDDDVLSNYTNPIFFVEAEYEGSVDPVYFFAEERTRIVEDKRGKKSREDSYYEFFTDTWLFTYQYKDETRSNSNIAITKYNVEYLISLRNNSALRSYQGSSKKNPEYVIEKNFDFKRERKISKWHDYAYLIPWYTDAETIEDLRRIYETLPRENWFLPAVTSASKAPDITMSEKSAHTVTTAQQLYEAIGKAKSGDTIIILCDIRVQRPDFLIKNKKLKIVGLTDQQPRIFINRDSDFWGNGKPVTYQNIFRLESASVEFENIIIDGGSKAKGIFAVGKSSITLGYNTEITRCEEAIKVSKNTTLVINGAYIHHNTVSVIGINTYGPEYGSGKVQFISGKIAYNVVTWQAINIKGKTSSFVMEGGSIHDNANSSSQNGLIAIGGGAKAEIKGGKIYNNIALDSSPIVSLAGGTLTMSGGEIFDNRFIGQFGGGIVMQLNHGKNKTKFTMTGGKIYNNHPGVSYFEDHKYDNGNIRIMAWKGFTTATFEMKGGEIFQTDYVGNFSDILVEGENASLVYSGGTLDLGQVSTTEGGKLVNKK